MGAPPAGAAPGTPKADAPGGSANPASKASEEKKVDWKKVPVVAKRPPTGWWSVPQSGPGYYSLCDAVQGNYRDAPPKFPRGQFSLNSTPYFDYDYRYLEDPKNTQHEWSDCYKRLHFGPEGNWLFSTGGEVRDRYMNELSSRGSGTNNFYNNFRVRAYGDLWYKDQFRVFVDFMDTEIFGNSLPPNPNDASGPELQNAFVEAKVGDPFGGPLSVRVGRQELLYGSQRLISPPDWANTRRTFQGAKAFWSTEQWSVDAFWVQPVVQNLDKFDSVDNNRNLFGLWTTYRPKAGTFFDLYYLGLAQGNTTTNNGDIHTFGSRYTGDVDKHFLYDFEGAVQFGERGTRHNLAKMMVAGLGWRFTEVPWTPHVWVYYDYASGDKDPTGRAGSNRTFNQLFPQGHNYFGYLDLVARQNIHDLNLQVSVTPQPWMNLSMQYHSFNLDSTRDALYNARGQAIRQDRTGRSGNAVGEELDLLALFHLTAHQDFMIGYSKFFGGTFWKRTGNPNNVELFYAQYSLKW
ncbi:alginate export family protein [Gemmata sp. G18]|uniref:Alginate export family protein n=1 Tax=Gemmata palustris TaxID=2822762 RepID=A0ABS5C3T1_9BACT|nr:alginate export family protein [Gemmata palustris]MBP3960626.1 alginate export family protein [Gemmata palustris]